MRKKIVSLALVLLLFIAGAPGAYALSLELPGGAAEPLVYTCADISCQLGDTAVLSITAESTDGGYLSYQWYRSLDGSNMSGSMIINAASSSYYADTSQSGTYYYFCVVTNTLNGASAQVISAPIAVRVESAPVIEGIGVLTRPNKVQYKEGDRLETAGLSVRVYTNQGYYDVSGGLECSPAVLELAGTQTITVRYEGKGCTFTVEVEAAKETVESISVLNMPSKTSYTVGDTLDTSGLVVRVVTNKQIQDITDGFSCTPKVLTTAGSQQIRVIYGIQSTTFTVTVAERAGVSPSPSVTPSPSSTPAASAAPSTSPVAGTEGNGSSPSPSPTRHVSSHQSHETNAGSAIIQLVFVLALLALVGLGAYVYTVQRKNRKDDSQEDE